MRGAGLGAGRLAGRAFGVYGRAFAPLAVVATLALAVVWTLETGFERAFAGVAGGATSALAGATALLAVQSVAFVWQLAATTALALRAARGGPQSLGAALRTGTRRLPHALAVCALCGAAVLAGLSVLLAPGIVALASLAAALPIAVDEEGGPWRAIGRSLDLTRGSRGPVLGALALVGGAALLALMGSWAVIGLWLDDASEPVLLLAAMSAFGLLAPLPAVAAAVTYAELRDRKEGRPAAELAKVFE